MFRYLMLFSALALSTAHAAELNPCRVVLVDTFNRFSSVIEVQKNHSVANPSESYTITNDAFSQSPWSEEVSFDQNGKMKTKAGVPMLSRVELLKRYTFVARGLLENGRRHTDSQLTWSIVGDSQCSEMELSLIEFMVMEWFYFG